MTSTSIEQPVTSGRFLFSVIQKHDERSRHRLESLDVFRGMTIAAMILVNNPGDWGAVFPQLMHAYWHGCTFADLIFPWFIFIMGFAMPFAFARRLQRGEAVSHLYRRIGQRAALLIALGLIVNAVARWPAVLPLRFTGVLQRIALAYLFAGVIVLRLKPTGWASALASLLIGHWALLALVPFAGHPAGTLTPEANLAGYVDGLVFGRRALSIPNDSEGLLGTLPAVGTALVGALAAELVRRGTGDARRIGGLLASGAIALGVGFAWSYVLPLNKRLWTGSYVLVATGLAMSAFTLVYAAVDVRGSRSWARPFLWLGVNPIAMYVLSDVVGHMLERAWVPQGAGYTTPKARMFWDVIYPAMGAHRTEWGSLAFAIGFVALWTAAAGVLYHRRIRIQV